MIEFCYNEFSEFLELSRCFGEKNKLRGHCAAELLFRITKSNFHQNFQNLGNTLILKILFLPARLHPFAFIFQAGFALAGAFYLGAAEAVGEIE